uniref:Serine protease 5 n=1 Tax=Holotrichia oblita TaxID=644536 RepID=A0A8D4LKY8_HOLOL|nr:serine protease 5 [Holotrichia oblita]
MFAFAVLLTLGATVSALPTKDGWRIVGGEIAEIGAYPFMVTLKRPVNIHYCGGTLVNSRTVLTAGHCVFGAAPSFISAIAGTNTIDVEEGAISSVALVVHPNYNEKPLENDIAMVILETGFQYSDLIGSVTLNSATIGAVPVFLIGWGVTGINDPNPNYLQRLDTRTITHSECQAFWGSAVNEDNLCTLSPVGQGLCYGDSGSPLLQTSDHSQVGIVSAGDPCALGSPDIYVRISSYVPWINSVANS